RTSSPAQSALRPTVLGCAVESSFSVLIPLPAVTTGRAATRESPAISVPSAGTNVTHPRLAAGPDNDLSRRPLALRLVPQEGMAEVAGLGEAAHGEVGDRLGLAV